MKFFRFPIMWLFCACMILSSLPGAAADIGKSSYGLLFLPFNGVEAGKYAAFRESIEEMLLSRLSAGDQVQIIESGLTGAQLAQIKERGYLTGSGASEQVFLISGTLFAMQGGLEIQVVVDPLSKAAQRAHSNAPLRFSRMCPEDSVIAGVSSLADDIGGKLFRPQASPPAYNDSGAGAFTTSHPEEAYKRGQYASLATSSGAFGFQARNVGARSRYNFKEDLLGVQVVDADGDGRKEVLLFFSHRLEVRRFLGRELKVLDSCPFPSGLRVHAVDTADLDGDGVQEIYLSATDGLRLSSAILSWRGKGKFSWDAKNIRYYIRPVFLPGEGYRLVVQRRGLAKTALRRAGLFLAEFSAAGALEPGKRLPLPASVNLFDFYYADLDGDGAQELVIVDSSTHLKVYSSGNELLWVSEKLYGGSKNYIGPSQGTAVDKQSRDNFSVDENADRELLYLPGRVVVADFNGDGRQEIVVSESNMPGVGFFVRLRPYDSGKIVGLSWDGQELRPFWETGTFRGYLSDFSFLLQRPAQKNASGVPGRPGRATLYVANLPASGSFLSIFPGNDTSVLTVGAMEFSFEKPAEKK